ncbi:MAG: M24 family metallopeptidase [Eubacteriales bacterium]|nr:M24 family metallopeptidase [Eubacteriales bacterium]
MELVEELRGRQAELDKIAVDKGLDAIVVVGNCAVGPSSYGSFRYFADHRSYYYLHSLVARPGKKITICVGSILHKDGILLKGFEDTRFGADVLPSVLKVLAEQPVKRVGVSFEMLPVRWENGILEQCPGVELVDVDEDIYALRRIHSPYEIECFRRCAQITDIGYEAVLKAAKPGAKMSDLHALLDYAMFNAGAEETFTKMSCGVFSLKDNALPRMERFHWPDERTVKEGDNIAMSISAKYCGYWTQLVRVICVGEKTPDAEKAWVLQQEALKDAAGFLAPGIKLGDLVEHMFAFAEEHGYAGSLPFGHVVGLDLDEGGSGLGSDYIIPENAVVVLHPALKKEGDENCFFWGDTYLVTKDGAVRLNECGTDLLSV